MYLKKRRFEWPGPVSRAGAFSGVLVPGQVDPDLAGSCPRQIHLERLCLLLFFLVQGKKNQKKNSTQRQEEVTA